MKRGQQEYLSGEFFLMVRFGESTRLAKWPVLVSIIIMLKNSTIRSAIIIILD